MQKGSSYAARCGRHGILQPGIPVSAIRFLAMGILCATLTGCVGLAYWAMDASATNKNATGHEKLWGGYTRDAEYELLVDVFLHTEDRGNIFPALVPSHGAGLRRATVLQAPSSVQVYEKNPAAWPKVLGVVRKGTRIKPVQLRKNHALFIGGWVSVVAQVLDGPHQGTLVIIDDLSLSVDPDADPLLEKPDPLVLRRIETM